MFLQNLPLINFKNYDIVETQFSQRINCFIGNNGVGKTNILDSIFYLSFCKSCFNFSDSSNIKHKRDFFVIQGTYNKNEKLEKIYCGVKLNQKKQFKRNDKEYSRLSEHIGVIPLVIISPMDSNLIVGGSDERRRFVDTVISQFDINYLRNLIKYNKALTQRNAFLKSISQKPNFDSDSIEIWNEQLVFYGEKIHEKRVDFINRLIPLFQKYYDIISENSEIVDLEYSSQLNDSGLEKLLIESLEKDKILQYTTKGTHKDDLVFKLKNFPLKRNGSQGQQKTFIVALKLAQYDFMKMTNDYKPILLLDDIFDKFDAKRVKQIVKLLSGNNFGQIFISDTSQDRLHKILSEIDIENIIFNIENGIITQADSFANQ